ncbi:MAG: hypothetical protein Q4C87_01420 [Actinomycetaceae bacterium]|nr:hypothetical protein [Actinomycetaceae bacterium]
MSDQHKSPADDTSQPPLPGVSESPTPIEIPMNEGGAASGDVAGAENADSVLKPVGNDAGKGAATSVPSRSRRNEAPAIITFFTVAIAVFVVAIFFAVQGLSTLGGIQWSVPELPDLGRTDPENLESEQKGPEYIEPERGPVKPDATDGIGEGRYEVPADPWLHPGYAGGVTTWSASGTVLGVSRDKTTIVFGEDVRGENKDKITGYDVKTGKEKWAISEAVNCNAMWNGIAYCTDATQETEGLDFVSIDLATGNTTRVNSASTDADSAQFIAHWQGYTYWNVPNSSNVPGEGVQEPETLIAIKDGKVQWDIEIAANADCVAGDGAIGCGYYQGDNMLRAEIFNGSTGEFIAEFTGDLAVEWYRDGFSITDKRGENTESKQYTWAAKEKRLESYVPFQAQPDTRDGILMPMPIVGQSGGQGFVDPSGAPLLVSSENSDGVYTYTDFSTTKVIAVATERKDYAGDAWGEVYVLWGGDRSALAFFDENGREIFSEADNGIDALNYYGGILVRDYRLEEDSLVTVFAPQG